MTAQIGDKFYYKDKDYSIVAMSTPLEFTPKLYGITPVGCCSACWRGYWCEYKITNKLILKSFSIHSLNSYYPSINDVEAIRKEDSLGFYCYKNINIHVPYTGRILVGDGMLWDYYLHMGFQRAWAYEELLEFIFENGSLVSVNDHSLIAKMLRKQIDKDPNFWDKISSNICQYVESSFDLSMKTKAWWIEEEEEYHE